MHYQAHGDREDAVPELHVHPSHGKSNQEHPWEGRGEGDAPRCSAQEQLLEEAAAQSY